MDAFSFDWAQTGRHLLSLSLAYLLAFPIGWWWEKARHSVGIRTFPLVAVASCCYLLVARQVLGGGTQNLDRVIQGLMTGIGFIGGGAIFKAGATVRGTATAASIWSVGALGAAVACGAYDIAVLLSLITLATLIALRPLKDTLDAGPIDKDSA